jgi:hypothetical protein
MPIMLAVAWVSVPPVLLAPVFKESVSDTLMVQSLLTV